MTNTNFDKKMLEAFSEAGNVGAGHSAIALTKIFSREVDMTVPFIRQGTPNEILGTFDLAEDDMVGYQITDINNPLRYKLSVLFKKSVMKSILDLMALSINTEIIGLESFTDMQKSLIQEVGSTILLRYIAALNKMLKVESMPETAPVLFMDKALPVLRQIGYDQSDDASLIFIQLDLFTDEHKFECHLFIQPHEADVEDYRKAFFG